jgi:hypothetical protein
MRRNTNFLITSAVLAAMIVLFGITAFAQTIYGSLAGRVLDRSGAVVQKASVTIRNRDTGAARELVSDDTGFWRANALPVGNYSIEVSAAGFEKVIQGPYVVEASVERAIDITLDPGAVTETVSVVAEAPLIEATKSQLSRGVETKRILELPGLNSLNGLALLQPGVAPSTNSRPGSGFSVNGARPRSNNFMIDGANNNDQSLATPRQSLPPEALGEFRIITNNFSAEYGRNAGSVVMQTTKAGTNEFHGILRWAWLGNGLDSLTTNQQRTFSAQKTAGRTDKEATRLARGVVVNNNWLFSAGGPVIKNKVFFFSSYDKDDYRTTVSNAIAVVPSPAAYALLDQNASYFAPGALAFLKENWPAANDPTARGNVTVAIPNGPTMVLPMQQYNIGVGGGIPFKTRFDRGIMKVDSPISTNNNLSVRYIINDELNPGSPQALGDRQRVGQVGRNQNLTANYVRIFTPTLLAENRFAYGRRSFSFPENLPAQFQIAGGPTIIGNQNYPQYRTDNLYEMTNNWSWTRGNHTMRFGGNYLYYDLNSFFAPSYRGVIYYPSMLDFLIDRNGEFSQYAGEGNTVAGTHELQTFFADDWRVTPSLTLNMGLRYEFTSAPLGYFSNAKPDTNNFAPRFGFAFSPRSGGWLTGNGKLSIRGGYAISYDQVFQNILLNNARNYPRGVSVALTGLNGQRLWNPASRPQITTPDQYTGNPLLLPTRIFSPDKRIAQPYSQQFSFGFERQFGGDYVFRSFYVGSRGIGIIRESERNLGFYASAVNANPSLLQPVVQAYGMKPTTVGGQAAFRVDPTRGSILVGDGFGQSTYHSLQLTMEKRFSNGFIFQGNYVWSSFISNADDILGGQANRTLPSTPFNMALDRGRSGFDQPHRFVGNFYYEFPRINTTNGILDRIVNGWQTSGIFTAGSGFPYPILNANNALGILPGQIATVHLSQRANYNPAGSRSVGTAPGVTNNAFIANPTNSGIIGNLGANTERGGQTWNWDGTLSKRIRTVGERQAIQLRWEVFNILNFRNFTAFPANTVSANTNNVTFNNLGFTNASGRTMLFNVRYEF